MRLLQLAGMLVAQSVVAPVTQAFDPLQVWAGVSVAPVQKAAAQSVAPLHWTHAAFVALHLVMPDMVAQLTVAPVAQAFEPLQLGAGVSIAPLHEAAEQSVAPLHWTHPFATLHLVVVVSVAQLVTTGVGQVPVPVQVAGAVYMAPAQAAVTHGVVLDQSRHAPFPLQPIPEMPQVAMAVAVHWLWGSSPLTTLPQVPSAPAPLAAALHAWQVPVQAELQHTPSTQKPLVHWSPPVQAAATASVTVQVPPLFVRSQN